MTCKRFSYLCCLALATTVILGSALDSRSQTPQPINPVAPPASLTAASPASLSPTTHALTADDLDAFLDGLVPQQLKRENIAGAVVIVVKDGRVLYQKGYGHADVKNKIPMDADRTLVRPGSVSKLFTWTAVMQQVEQGNIDLDRNVNDYLDFRIPDTYPQPITMRELMTHTAGFEDTVKDLMAGPGKKPDALRDYLRTHIPQRVYAPGTTPAYSNYGATLAGYIVQRVSGVSFADYAQKNIFEPLAMKHTTFVQPLRADWDPLLSKGYALASGEAKLFETVNTVPAGSTTTSAVDISHFMLANLQGGEWNGAHILKPETVALMHSPQFAVDPKLEHMCLGFYQEDRNGQGIIGHGGDTLYFHSDLHLIPDAHLGFFVSYNSTGRGEVSPRTPLFLAFLNRYFPYTIPPAPKAPDALHDARLVEGEYTSSRRSVTDILSFFSLFGNVQVIAKPDGTLVTEGMQSQDQLPKEWQEIGPLLYREKDGQDRIGFTKNSLGQMVLSLHFPFEVSTRVSFIDTKNFNLFLIILIAIVSVSTVAFWPVSACIRRHYRKPLAMTRSERRWRLAIRLVMLLDLIYMVCWLALLAGGVTALVGNVDPTLRIIQMVGWLGSLGTLVVFYSTVKTWHSSGEWFMSHVGNLFVLVSALSFSWLLLHWHLLHFSLLY